LPLTRLLELDLKLSRVSKAKLKKLAKALGAPAPEETPEPVPSFLQDAAGDKAPTEEERLSAKNLQKQVEEC